MLHAATPAGLPGRGRSQRAAVRAAAGPSAFAGREDSTQLELRVTRVRDGAQWRRATGRGRLLVSGRLESIRPGDRLRIWGRLQSVAGPGNPGQFDGAEYARAERRLFGLRAPHPACVQRLEEGRGWSPRRWVGRFRAYAAGQLRGRLPERRGEPGLRVAVGPA